MTDTDVVVIGAGLVGAAFALAASRIGFRVDLLSNAGPPMPPGPNPGRVYALSQGSRGLLQSIGVWQRLDPARIQAVVGMRVAGDRPGAGIDLDALDGGVEALAWIVESDAVAWALAEQVATDDGITCRWQAHSVSLRIDAGAAHVDLADGSSYRAALLVGADGRDSWVRTEVGIRVRGRNYAHQGVVANFTAERAHGGIARQWFRADGVLALLPMPLKQVSMVWSAPDAVAADLMALDDGALCERVMGATGDCLGTLRLVTPPSCLPITLGHARQLVGPRLALVGDAAHNLHPLAGQGVNLGLRDVDALCRILGADGRGEPGARSVLRRYERSRREDVATMIALTDGLQRLFSSRLPGIAWARNRGLDLVSRLPHLKGLLLQHALC